MTNGGAIQSTTSSSSFSSTCMDRCLWLKKRRRWRMEDGSLGAMESDDSWGL